MAHKNNIINLKQEPQELIFIEVAGFSMWPFVRQGEKLIIKKFPIEDLKIGDVILYQKDNQMICHRLVSKVKEREGYVLYLRGDNSRSFPEHIPEQMYLGRVVGVLRHGVMVPLTNRKQQFINRVIVLAAPLVRRINKIIKPWYSKIRKIKF